MPRNRSSQEEPSADDIPESFVPDPQVNESAIAVLTKLAKWRQPVAVESRLEELKPVIRKCLHKGSGPHEVAALLIRTDGLLDYDAAVMLIDGLPEPHPGESIKGYCLRVAGRGARFSDYIVRVKQEYELTD